MHGINIKKIAKCVTIFNGHDINSECENYVYRVSQEERTKLWEGVPYVKVYRYNPKTPISKVERLRR